MNLALSRPALEAGTLTLFMVCSHTVMMHWYDPETDPSQFMAALRKVRHLCTRAEHVRMTVPGSYILVQAIMLAIDDYAERETGNREYFWGKPHKAG
jgi:hypothetical protein